MYNIKQSHLTLEKENLHIFPHMQILAYNMYMCANVTVNLVYIQKAERKGEIFGNKKGQSANKKHEL